MTEEVKFYLDEAQAQMDKAVQHLEEELTKVRAGKATPTMLASVFVDYYGNSTPLNQVANVNTQDAKTLVIKPWEKQMLDPIQKAIMKANLGFTPQSDGENIRINLPPLTEERRKDLVKTVRAIGENSKVSIRNVRREAIQHIKDLQKDGLEEDIAKKSEDDVQKLTDKFITAVDKHLVSKESEIMAV